MLLRAGRAEIGAYAVLYRRGYCSGFAGLFRSSGPVVRIGRIGCLARPARCEDVGAPTDPDVGAEGVEPGDLSTVTATLLGAFGGMARISTQDHDRGSNSSGNNLLAPSRDRRREPNLPTVRS